MKYWQLIFWGINMDFNLLSEVHSRVLWGNFTSFKHPSVIDPVASIFLPGRLSEKASLGQQIFQQVSLFVRSLFAFFQTYIKINDICWVWEATNWPGKIKNFTRYRGGQIFTGWSGKKIQCVGSVTEECIYAWYFGSRFLYPCLVNLNLKYVSLCL